jgi:hypothetical protein
LLTEKGGMEGSLLLSGILARKAGVQLQRLRMNSISESYMQLDIEYRNPLSCNN